MFIYIACTFITKRLGQILCHENRRLFDVVAITCNEISGEYPKFDTCPNKYTVRCFPVT